MYLKERAVVKETKTQRDPPSTSSSLSTTSQMSAMPGLGQTEVKSQDLHPGLSHGLQGLSHLPRSLSRELDQKQAPGT